MQGLFHLYFFIATLTWDCVFRWAWSVELWCRWLLYVYNQMIHLPETPDFSYNRPITLIKWNRNNNYFDFTLSKWNRNNYYNMFYVFIVWIIIKCSSTVCQNLSWLGMCHHGFSVLGASKRNILIWMHSESFLGNF